MDRKKPFVPVLLVLLIPAVFPLLAQRKVIVVENAPRVRVRSAPRIHESTEKISVDLGTRLELIGETDGWYRVRLPDGSEGWISQGYASEEGPRGIVAVTSPEADVRLHPAETSALLVRAGRGELYRVSETSEGWVRVSLPTAGMGWLSPGSWSPFDGAKPPPGKAGDTEGGSETPSAPTVPGMPAIRTLIEAGDATGAEKLLEAHLEANPQDGESHAELARLLTGRGMEDAAAAHYQRASEPRVGAESGATGTVPGSLPPTMPENEGPQASPMSAETQLPTASQEAVPGPRSYRNLLVALAAACVLAASLWWYRQQRARSIEASLVGNRAPSGEKISQFLHETDDRLKSLDEALKQRFLKMRGDQEKSTVAPTTFEAQLGHLEEIRRIVLEQQEKINGMSDLLALQSEKIGLLEEENQKLKELRLIR